MYMRGNDALRFKFVFLSLLGILLLAACGPRKIGYGVLLWSPDEAVLETGGVIPLYEESRIKHTYTVPGAGGKGKQEIPTWRIRPFPKEKEAENFAKEFEPVKHVYATSNRRALPVREKADRLSQRIYRLRENEKMKILELGTTPSDENGLQGFWYKVLTEEGVTGYCFDYYLTVFDEIFDEKTNTRISSARNPSEEATARILTTNWRPAYFREMIAQRRVDLVKFKPAYGLFISSETRQIKLSLPGQEASTSFSRIRETTPGSFLAEGGTMQFQIRGGGNELVVYYLVNGNQRSDVFIAFEQDIEEIISQEQERRRQVLEAFLQKGRNLASSAYGKISLSDDGSFVWEGFERLVPTVISPGIRGSGKIEFSCFIDRDVKERYDGVVTFRFAGTGADRGANFFYRFSDQGTQFVFIPPANIEDNIVRRENMNPLVIFFSPS